MRNRRPRLPGAWDYPRAVRTTAQLAAPVIRGSRCSCSSTPPDVLLPTAAAEGDSVLSGVRTGPRHSCGGEVVTGATPQTRRSTAGRDRTHACAGEDARGKHATNVSSGRALCEPAHRKTLLEIDSLCSRRIRSAGIALPNPKDRRFTW